MKLTLTVISKRKKAWAQKFRAGGEFDKGRENWLHDWPGLEPYLRENSTHRIAFDDFVDYFLKIGPQNFNPHWRLASDACDVCSRPYDYIVKVKAILF